MSSLKYKFGFILGLLFISANFASAQWHNSPINCYFCDGDECISSLGRLNVCQGDVSKSQTCVTIFGTDPDTSVIGKGCTQDISQSQAAYCASNPDKCISCSSNGCNLANDLSEFVQCLSCDSKTDKSCVLTPNAVTSTKLCYKSCMVALYARDATNPSLTFELSRSCLDDKDMDDRTLCSGGGDKNCVACEGAKCNVAKLPEVRFNCFQCDEGEDCSEASSEECVSFTEDDQCYFLFDEFSDIVGMGCRSDLEPEVVEQRIKEKKLVLCDGADCNTFENVPQPNKCKICSSDSEEGCAINPLDVESAVTCGIPYSQCYSKVSDVIDGVTIRGCLSDLLDDEFYQCLLNGNKNCQSCSGSGCNSEIVPEDRIKCQRCSSTDDTSCHKTPTALSVCPSYSENDTCVSAYSKGVTTRGCGSDFTCDPANPKSCQICSAEGCNTENVKKSSEESYGVFQSLPINCYHCSGEECEEPKGLLKKCEGSLYQDCLSVFSSEGKVISRGCENIVEQEYSSYCEANPNLCFNCKSNGCNTMTSATDYVECIYCDTANDPDCVQDLNSVVPRRKCTKGCVTALYPRSEDSKIQELIRTCLDDVESDNVEECGQDANCVQCTGSSCNSIAIPQHRLSCNTCTVENCDAPVSKVCSAYSGADQCFMLFDETLSVARMGCKSELTEAEIKKSIKQLFLCDGENCNDYHNLPDANICAVCNSTSNVLCATNPASVSTVARCQVFPYTQCYSRVAEDGSTARGCLLSLEIDEFLDCLEGDGAECQPCVGSNCNKQVFPADRQSCYRCSSSSDANCEALPTGAQVCPLYVQGDTCVTKVVDGVTNRGCGQELTCGDLGRKNCRSCSGTNCNSVDLIGENIGDPGLWQSLPINCYTCEGDECATSFGLLKVCEGDKLQTCTSVFDQEGKVIARGCSDLVTANHGAYCDENSSECIDCKSNGCNLATTKSDYVDCIFCDGQTNSNCTVNTAGISRTRKCNKACMTALYPKTSDADASYALTRTCLDDKDLDDREKCASDPLCQSCSGTSCNVQLIPEVRKSCYHCSGESCQLPTARTCNSYSIQEQCYILFDEVTNVIEMGCKSDYNPGDIRTMLLAKRLFLCDDDDCNSFEALPQTRSCNLCNSRTDEFCATSPQNVAGSTTCNRLPITDCYTRILSDGHTERGCLSSLNGDQFLDCYYKNSTDCNICADRLCNAEIFPADRLACHTCNSSEDASCDGSPKHAAVCLKYSSEQTCITSLDSGITQRGCSDQLTCDPVDSTSCRICNTSNCNVVNLKRNSDANPGFWQSLPLNCYTCSGDECAATQTRLNVCSGNIHQHCVTVFGESGAVVRRGCSDGVEEEYGTFCDENSGNCFNCNSNGCNTAASLDDYVDCIYCDSRANKNCVLDVAAISRTRRCNKACMVALFPRSANASSIFDLSRSCLDDKDLDDRDSCGSDKSLCKKCNSEGCNEADAIADRLECYSCLGESCENTVSEPCLAYAENDKCFMLFDEENSVERMGCVSELDDEELEDSLDKLFTCSGKNCNDFSNIPQPQSCGVCDSKTDVRCATSPRGVPTVSRCSNLPHVDCFSRVKTDGTTARGCVSDLTKALRHACLSGNDSTCSTCKGDGCNLEIFPVDRLQCHKCNSIDDPTCQDTPNAPYVCPIYSADEICSSKLVNDVTYRSCGDDFICDDTDKQRCKLCNTTNCNRANLYQNKIGYPGKWQSLPINCLTCFRDECNDTSTTLLRKCESNNLQNCVTVFNMNDTVVQRGCSDSIYSGFFDRHCDNHPELCTYCKSSGCNNANSLDDYVDCVFCDSTTNVNCTSKGTDVSRTRKCQKKCMTALYPRSGDDDPAYELSRSCLDDKDLDDREECASGNEEYCKFCEGDSCNTVGLPENRLSCWRCSGEDCEDPVEAECPSYRENDRCLILFDNANGIIQQGCASDFDSSFLTAFRKKILWCNGNSCNDYNIIPSPHRCLVCDSANDTLCATKPESLIAFTHCTNLPYTSCYTRIEDGLTKRGCLSDVEIETIDECVENGDSVNCNVCADEYCNIEVYPAGRRSCHRCSSKDDPTCQSNPSDPGVCPLYQEDDECVVEISGETTNRGCISEFTCNANDRATCRICPNNNCNTVDLMSNYVGDPGLWQDLPLSCYECEGTACQSTGDLNACSGNNLQNCMTVFDSSNIVVKRGCSDSVMETHEDYCDTNGGKCQSCKSSACNNVVSLDDYVDCVFCDSATNPDCVLNPEGQIRTRKCHGECMAALYPKSLEDDPSYELSRSCLDDKNSEDRLECASGDKENCKACTEPSCNKFAFPSERHQCLTCRGDGCENAKSQDCVSYHPTDQCYILFDKSSTIVAMGCRSEYEQSGITSLIQTKSILLCDGKNCNSYESIPNPQQCVVCNSATDLRCATNPNLIINATTCSSLPYTGCFTRINSDGDTVRGCQSDLPNEEFYGCYTESDSVCSKCAGGRCNTDVYPANRLRCHRCNSLVDPKCAELPASNGVCPKFTENESCVSSYKDGLTYRGCSSELSCDVSNKKICRVCTGSACNVQNLEHVAKDGEPGKWQDLPINCYTCEGTACATSEGLSLQMCTNNNVQNCMTVFNADGVVIQRGCSDPVLDAQETWCEANLDKCYRCNSNGCNKAFSLDDYVECLSCDTSTDASCVKDPSAVTRTRKCYKSCMTALYPRSTEDDPAFDTTRTCLDDKDLDDRETCQEGSEKLCAACDNGKCNDKVLPADRRSCYQCLGDECQEPKAELCSGYRSDDQCFIMFDEQRSIVEMGCKSDLTISQSIELVKAKRLFLCDGDDCNHFDALPTSQACALCNSRTDVDCAVNPSDVFSLTTCSLVPFTECYSRVLNDGATERGCLSSLLGNDFYDCLIGNSTSCTACTGRSCNNKVFPVDRISCYICDSFTDPNCEVFPTSASLRICPKYAEEETCVTSFSSGTTYRACGTSHECDVSNRKNCRICSSAGCNIVDLASKQDDNYGKWQDLPLTCFNCEGASECQLGLGEATICENNNEQDCSTVFNAEGQVVRRGCSDQVDIEHGEYCDENAGNCLSCKSNKCNTATALSEFEDCVYCDSNKDPNCVSNPRTSTLKRRKCQGGCMAALYPSDSSSNPAYDMMRTCLNDKESTDQTKCQTGEEPFCKSCAGVACNVDDLPEDRLRCHSCLDDSCEEPVSELCPLYKEGDQCFVRFDNMNSVTEMGCLSAFRDQEVVDILKTKQIYICEGEDCNALNKLPAAQRCSICNSASDVNCATNPHLVGSVGTCSLFPYTDCYSQITAGGLTQRGCLVDLPANDFAQCILSGGDKCSHCVGDGCNRQIFPASRLRCYSCSSDTDPDCESLPLTTAVCPYIRNSEKCVSALGGNRTERGCSSQLLCDTSDKSTCRHCSFTGCNTLDLINRVDDGNHGKWQDLPLRCHNCTGDACLNSLGPALTCTGGDQQDCMTIFDQALNTVRRGCQYDVEDEYDLYCRQNPNYCMTCKSNECNDAWELSNYVDCIYCNSEIDSTCATNPKNADIPTRRCKENCMAATFTAANGTVQVIRTCLDDKELATQRKCSDDVSGKDCSSCENDSCNSFNYPTNRLACHVCQGANCSTSMPTEYCAAYLDGDTCFVKYEGLLIDLAGCTSAVDRDVMQDWKEKNKLYTCSGDNCNALEKLPNPESCLLCDSSKDLKCATNPSAVTTLQVCNAPVTACYSQISSGATQRGCLQSLSYNNQIACQEGGNSALCDTCDGSRCNSEIYPSERRRCHICTSETDEKCKAEPAELLICPNYMANDKCVVKFANGITERGCTSDLTCDTADTNHCRICPTDGCNIDLLDNAAHSLISNSMFLTLLVAIASVIVAQMSWT